MYTWNKVRKVAENLRLTHNLQDTSIVICYYRPRNNTKRRKTILKFIDLNKFFWTLHDNNRIEISEITITDENDTILYKNDFSASAIEKKPEGEGKNVLDWNRLSATRKSVLIKVLMSQIENYYGDNKRRLGQDN